MILSSKNWKTLFYLCNWLAAQTREPEVWKQNPNFWLRLRLHHLKVLDSDSSYPKLLCFGSTALLLSICVHVINVSQNVINVSQNVINVSQNVVNVSQNVVNVSQNVINVSQTVVNMSQNVVNVSQKARVINVSQKAHVNHLSQYPELARVKPFWFSKKTGAPFCLYCFFLLTWTSVAKFIQRQRKVSHDNF